MGVIIVGVQTNDDSSDDSNIAQQYITSMWVLSPHSNSVAIWQHWLTPPNLQENSHVAALNMLRVFVQSVDFCHVRG